MATIISKLNNQSDTPVAYLGVSTLVTPTPTGWAAWGFAPQASHDFGWTVETGEKKQALLTKAGVFYIWDDKNWNILYEAEGSTKQVVLIKLHGPFNPNIVLTVDAEGNLSATQT